MSHFTEVKTQLTDRACVRAALQRMGYGVSKGASVQVRGFFGETTEADFKIDTGTTYDIGFKETEKGFEVLGDWDLMPKVAGIERDEFLKKLKQQYAVAAVLKVAKEKRLEVEVDESGDEFEIVVSQW